MRSNRVKSHSDLTPPDRGRAAIREMAAENAASLTSRRTTLWVVLGLILVTLLAYYRVAGNGFVDLDDGDYITHNAHVQQGLTPDGVLWAFTHFHSNNWHPVTWMSHMLDVTIFGDWAGGHHLVSLVFHIAATLLLFAFLRSTTRRLWPSALVAALFALHPLHVQSVAWASERKDVLSAFFLFATLVAYSSYAQKPSRRGYMAVVVLFALGLMAKPMLVTLPAVLLLVDYWPLQRNRSFWLLFVEKLPLILMSAASSAVTAIAQQSAISPYESLGFSSCLSNAIVSYWRYIAEMLWPAGLAVLYLYPTGPIAAEAVLVAAGMALVTYLVWRLRQHRYLVVGWLWYMITLVPVLGIIQVGSQSHADRYTYIPLTGLFIMLAWGLSELTAGRALAQQVATAAMALVLCVLGFITWQTTAYWRDSATLFERAIAVTKDNYVMMTDLGVFLTSRNKPDEGLFWLQKALAIKPRHPYILDGIGMAMYKKGKYDEAAMYAAQALAVKPDMEQAHFNMGMALTKLGRLNEAEAQFRTAVAARPDWPEALSSLGQVVADLGRVDEAKAILERSLSLNPDLADGHFGLGSVYSRKGNFAAAAVEFRRASQLHADFQTLKNLAGCLMATGDLPGAEVAIRQAIQLEPNRAEGHMDLAMVLNAADRKADAMAEAEIAIKLDPSDNKLRAKYNALTEAAQ